MSDEKPNRLQSTPRIGVHQQYTEFKIAKHATIHQICMKAVNQRDTYIWL